MKYRNIKLIVLAAMALSALNSCTDSFVEVDPIASIDESNYYKTEAEAYSGLVAVYDIMKKESGGFENMIAMLNAGSDDFYAGGGSASDGAGIQSFSNYTINPASLPNSFWTDYYQGIFRANVLLQKLPTTNMDATKKARFVAETRMLRAYYYFQLVTMFKNIPLITEPVNPTSYYNVLQAKPEDVYAFIENELKAAITDLPTTINAETEAGRVSQGAGKALLGKVYLFEKKNTEAAQILAEVNGTPGGANPYGYSLLTDFADLWKVDNKFNSESIWEATHTSKSNATWGAWGSGTDEGNSLNVMVGPRGYSAATPTAPKYETGWSFNTVTQDLRDALVGDTRYDATIADLSNLVATGQATYSPGYMDTGYFLKKFMPTNADLTTGGGDVVLNYRQNTYVIRLADTYLMEAEALGGTGERAQALLNAVRRRANMPVITVSMDAVMKERRLELAGEGHRWHDLIRTGQAASKLASRGFIAGKHEIWPIPLNQLTNTKLIQNDKY
ncbi:MAG: RagB/SusD family nutrient uptake outer membrane protein [Flavobacterium sp.]